MSAPENRVPLWEDFVLRAIAIWKLLHAVFFTAVGFGLLKLRHVNLVDFINDHLVVPYHLNPEGELVDWMLEHAEKITPHLLVQFGWGAFIYAALFAVEGVGLYLRKRWAEWLVVVVAGLLLPFEFRTLIHHVVWWKIVIITGNLLIVAYLVHRILLDSRSKKLRAESGSANEVLDQPQQRASDGVTTKVR